MNTVLTRLRYLSEEARQKQGFCYLQNSHYAKVKAIRTDCRTGRERSVEVSWLVDFSCSSRPKLRFINGVTGYEAFYLKDLRIEEEGGALCLCAGTKNRWDTLIVPEKEWGALKHRLRRAYA